MRLSIAPLIALCLLGASGCARGGDAAESWVELGGKRYTVEIADDDAERARGLMFRDQLASDRGMLFLFDEERGQAFWMKNTRIPLDILYFDAQRRLVSQQLGVPPCSAGDRCPSYPSDGPARYVLELNAGEASKLGLASGAPLTFGPGIPTE